MSSFLKTPGRTTLLTALVVGLIGAGSAFAWRSAAPSQWWPGTNTEVENEADSGLRPPEAPFNMRLAMIFFSVLCILIGIVPGLLYQLLPYNVDFVPYTVDHVLLQLQLLLFSGLAFFVMLPWMQRTLTISLDIDWFYRKVLPNVAEMTMRLLSVSGTYLGIRGQKITGVFSDYFMRLYGPHGALSREIQTGVVVLLVVLMLGLYLLLYLITF